MGAEYERSAVKGRGLKDELTENHYDVPNPVKEMICATNLIANF